MKLRSLIVASLIVGGAGSCNPEPPPSICLPGPVHPRSCPPPAEQPKPEPTRDVPA